MSTFTSSGGQQIVAGTVEIVSYQNVTVSVPTASTEVTIVVPASAVYVRIYNRTEATTRVAFLSGESGTNYMTLVPGNSETWTKKTGATMSLYVQCTKGSQTLELVYGYP